MEYLFYFIFWQLSIIQDPSFEKLHSSSTGEHGNDVERFEPDRCSNSKQDSKMKGMEIDEGEEGEIIAHNEKKGKVIPF